MRKTSLPFLLSFLMVSSVFGCISQSTHQVILDELNESKKENLNLIQRIRKLEADLSQQSELLQSDTQEINRLKDQGQFHLSDIEFLGNRNRDLATKLSNLERRNRDFLDTLESLQIDLENTARDKKHIENRIKKLESAEEEAKALEYVARSLSKELNHYREKSKTRQNRKLDKQNRIKELQKDLLDNLETEIQNRVVSVKIRAEHLELRLDPDVIIDIGGVEISSDGQQILDRIGPLLVKADLMAIEILGHTDNIPIGPRLSGTFPSNWELSMARAGQIVRYMSKRFQISPTVLSGSGYGDTRPLTDNSSAEKRKQNRRIEILLFPSTSEKIGPKNFNSPTPETGEVLP